LKLILEIYHKAHRATLREAKSAARDSKALAISAALATQRQKFVAQGKLALAAAVQAALAKQEIKWKALIDQEKKKGTAYRCMIVVLVLFLALVLGVIAESS
jgi:hypothetical protein